MTRSIVAISSWKDNHIEFCSTDNIEMRLVPVSRTAHTLAVLGVHQDLHGGAYVSLQSSTEPLKPMSKGLHGKMLDTGLLWCLS